MKLRIRSLDRGDRRGERGNPRVGRCREREGGRLEEFADTVKPFQCDCR